MQWACDMYVQPISPFWIGVLCVAMAFYAVSLVAVLGLFEPIKDAVSRLWNRDLVKIPSVALLLWVGSLYVFGSTKPDVPPVVVQKGIKLTKWTQTSRLIEFEWESEDDRIGEDAVYLIQEYLDGKWQTVKEVKGKKAERNIYRLEGFTIDRTRKYRIATSITEGEE